MTKIKTYLAKIIRENSINIFSIDEYLTEMSETLHQRLMEDFEEYGVSLEKFFVTTIVKPEEDASYQKFKAIHFRQYADIAEAQLRQKVGLIEQETESQRLVIEAKGLAQKRATEGYTYHQERSFDVAEQVASNEGVGEMSNIGIGLGMMTGVGGAIGGAVGTMMQNTMSEVTEASEFCPNCNKTLPLNSKFCLECGQKIEQAASQNKCPKCETQVPNGGKFCLECGEKLG